MRKKKDIELKHKKILNIIKQHNKNYYNYNKPTISDSEYDQIKIEVLNLEKNIHT